MVPMDDNQAEKDEEGWAILPSMGDHSLGRLQRLIRDYIAKFTVSYLHLDGDYTGLTLDPVQNVIMR